MVWIETGYLDRELDKMRIGVDPEPAPLIPKNYFYRTYLDDHEKFCLTGNLWHTSLFTVRNVSETGWGIATTNLKADIYYAGQPVAHIERVCDLKAGRRDRVLVLYYDDKFDDICRLAGSVIDNTSKKAKRNGYHDTVWTETRLVYEYFLHLALQYISAHYDECVTYIKPSLPKKKKEENIYEKIPTLFKRQFEEHQVKKVLPEINPSLEIWESDKCVATVKWDGSCCAIIDGKFYKRYDAKKGKTPPKNAIPCCEPDPITGHWPHWVPVNKFDPSDRWFVEAFKNVFRADPDNSEFMVNNGTFEAIGPHFQGNPYGLKADTLIRHGKHPIKVNRTFKDIKDYLTETHIEGIVFWVDDKPICKIKRTDFGYKWPIR